MSWEARITSQGNDFLATRLGGETLAVTRILTGSSVVIAGNLSTMTAIFNPRQEFDEVSVSMVAGGIQITKKIINSDLAQSYNLRQVGVFGIVGGEEKLIAVAQSDEDIIVPAAEDSPGFAFTFILRIFVGGAASAIILEYDNEPTAGSENLLTSGVIYNALAERDRGITAAETRLTTAEGAIGDLQTAATAVDNRLTEVESQLENDFIRMTAIGSPAVFNAAKAEPVKDCHIDILATQDFHGYSCPWNAGEGRNQIPLIMDDIKAANTNGVWSGDTYTVDGVSLTVRTDNDGNIVGIYAYGVASADVVFNLTTDTVPFIDLFCRDYVIMGGVSQEATTVVELFDIDDEKIDTCSAGLLNCASLLVDGVRSILPYLILADGVSVSFLFRPMLQRNDGSMPIFEPYSNICHFTPHTSAEITANGATTSISWQSIAGDVYAGWLHVTTGELAKLPYYASYNGENLVGPWISDRDVYTKGGVPSAGAQVVDLGGTLTTYELTPIELETVIGSNSFSASCGKIAVTHIAQKQDAFDALKAEINAILHPAEPESTGTPPTITTQPADVTVSDFGDTVTLAVAAMGTDLHYRWQHYTGQGVRDVGDDSPTLAFIMSGEWDADTISCVVYNEAGSVESRKAAVTSTNHPTLAITTQPAAVSGYKGTTATLGATASGVGVRYRWHIVDTENTDMALSMSYQSGTYPLPLTAEMDGNTVYCVVTDKYGDTVTSQAATVTIAPRTLVITRQPVDVESDQDGYALITITATGDGLRYLWYANTFGHDFKKVIDSTKPFYYSKINEDTSGKQVYCVVKDEYGNTVTSDTVTLTLYGNPHNAVSVSIPELVTVNASGDTATVTVTAVGEGLAYRWFWKAPTDSTFTLVSHAPNSFSRKITAANSGTQVYCAVKDKYGNIASSGIATLMISPELEPEPETEP